MQAKKCKLLKSNSLHFFVCELLQENASFWCTFRDRGLLWFLSAAFRFLTHFEIYIQSVNLLNLSKFTVMELLNIRFSFLCRTTRTNAEGKHPIVLRIVYRSERRDLFTGLHCAKDDWDTQACRLKKGNRQFLPINQNLDLIIHKAHNVFDQLKFSGQSFTLDELVDKLKGKEERPALLIDYLHDANEKLKSRLHVDITQPTYKKYVRSANHMLRFLETTYKVKNYSLQKMDGPFLEKYFQYLRPKRIYRITPRLSTSYF
jgi:hypothetical protein